MASSLTWVLTVMFLDMTPKVQETNKKNGWDSIKLKSDAAKETINKMKREHMGEKITNHIYLKRG